MGKKRKFYTAEEKVAIIRAHLLDKVPISDLCDRHGMHPTVFYGWQKTFFENGATAFDRKGDSRSRKLEKEAASLRARIAGKDEVIAEIMESHVALKKTLGGS